MENRFVLSNVPCDQNEQELMKLLESGFSKVKRWSWFGGISPNPVSVAPGACVSVDGDSKKFRVIEVRVDSEMVMLQDDSQRTQWVPFRAVHIVKPDEPPKSRDLILEYHLENAAERASRHFNNCMLEGSRLGARMATEFESDLLVSKTHSVHLSNVVGTYQISVDPPVNVNLLCNYLGGTGGSKAWDSAKFLARRIFHDPGLVEGKVVLELGAGLGLPSMVAARFAKTMYASDYITEILQSLETNFERSAADAPDPAAYRAAAKVLRLDWKLFDDEDEEEDGDGGDTGGGHPPPPPHHPTPTKHLPWTGPLPDVILFTDVVYNFDVAKVLAKVILRLLPPHGVVLGAMPIARAGVHEFRSQLKRAGLEERVETVSAADAELVQGQQQQEQQKKKKKKEEEEKEGKQWPKKQQQGECQKQQQQQEEQPGELELGPEQEQEPEEGGTAAASLLLLEGRGENALDSKFYTFRWGSKEGGVV